MLSGIFLPDYPDPVDNVYYLLLSKFAAANNFNLANYKNPAVDKLLNQYMASTSTATKAHLP